jgi:hypothetical protein
MARVPSAGGVRPYRLTKSRYVKGLNCRKALWLQEHDPERASPRSPAQQRILDQGTDVGRLAATRFPGGLLVNAAPYERERALAETREALACGAPAVFEAAFLHHRTLVRVDVLRLTKAGAWDLIEVKSTTKVKEEHLPDAAVQRFVAAGSGLSVAGVYLMHLNPECTFPDLSDLFVLEDVGAPVADMLGAVGGKLDELLRLLEEPAEPRVPVGPQCTAPYECEFMAYCWRHVPAVSVFDVPLLKSEAKAELSARGLLYIGDIPADFPLSPTSRRFVELFRGGRARVDWPAIRRELAGLKFPLYFLDFETDNPAVPRFAGLHPFERLPFQFSCHRLAADGELRHFEHLHDDPSDPRPPLANALGEALGPQGTLVAYNASFEKGVLGNLAAFLGPGRVASKLEAAAGRLWDLLGIFRNHYLDPAFGGSNSLKSVLPVLLPGFSYEGLEVAGGEEAMAAWERLLRLPEGEEKRRLDAALRAYCRQDSLALVEIYRFLTAGGTSPITDQGVGA